MKLSSITKLLHMGDSILCCTVLFPSMVLYWRGIWDLWGYYLPGVDDGYHHWSLFSVGSITVFGYFVQPLLDRNIPKENLVVYFILTRMYMYVYAALHMSYWRGVWEIPDYYMGFDLTNNLIMYVVLYGVLLVCRGGRTTIFPPMYAINDTREDLLQAFTRFRTKVITSDGLPEVEAFCTMAQASVLRYKISHTCRRYGEYPK